MMKHLILALCLVGAVSVSGCTSFKKITGQTNDTVLPGQREEIIPDDQKTAQDPVLAGQKQSDAADTIVQQDTPVVPCNPKKQLCPPATKTLQ